MKPSKSIMKMPEFLIFIKVIAIGFVFSAVWHFSYYLGSNFEPVVSDISICIKILMISLIVLLCITYISERGGYFTTIKLVRSLRVDLLITFGVGIWINILISPWFHETYLTPEKVNPNWAPLLLLMFCAMLFSPLFQKYCFKPKRYISQLHFMADDEIGERKEDLLKSEEQAKSFAETVLASRANTGLVFGVDGPWGVGKTSFINLAQRHWEQAEDKVIVCRFEPLRHASEPDLTDRLIRHLSGSIQKKAFAPEFRPTASRYARLIKGKADISFFGFKLSIEPSQETVDELLVNIDETLKRIGHRVIIVIDDLDRLDTKTINNVLFATRRTFNLSQATYILCYDTEVLAGKDPDGARAREFLEKFVTIKLSLFVDSSSIRDFLRRDWNSSENQLGSIPSDTMIKLGAILSELADILDSDLAANYLPLLGDLRKVKRFVNAMLLMQIEKSDLGLTDFDKRDLINLMLLNLNYPGLFRQIYGEETEGRGGTFSVRREFGTTATYHNSDKFQEIFEKQDEIAKFLLNQLFDVETLDLGNIDSSDEAFMASRACFNHEYARNLEKYLKLLVRFIKPEPKDTFIFYKNSVDKVLNGSSIKSVLMADDSQLKSSDHEHERFWSMLVSNSNTFSNVIADDAINTIIDYLPYYSKISNGGMGVRNQLIYSLLRLLNSVGGKKPYDTRQLNTQGHDLEIAWRIFGENTYQGKGIIDRLVSRDRDVLGWDDLMTFRLYCSADRQTQLYNLHSALSRYSDNNAVTEGSVRTLVIDGMRKLSQKVFSEFKTNYIEPKRNFFKDVDILEDKYFLSKLGAQLKDAAETEVETRETNQSVREHVLAERSKIKSFVIYQLSNKFPPKGEGIGCGYYDEFGVDDGGGIAVLMNRYIFDYCFNPAVDEDNVFFFLDYCLSHLSNPFFSENFDEDRFFPLIDELSKGLDHKKMASYWNQNKSLIKQRVMAVEDKFVYTGSYKASYNEDLPAVFKVLDELIEDSAAENEE